MYQSCFHDIQIIQSPTYNRLVSGRGGTKRPSQLALAPLVIGCGAEFECCSEQVGSADVVAAARRSDGEGCDHGALHGEWGAGIDPVWRMGYRYTGYIG